MAWINVAGICTHYETWNMELNRKSKPVFLFVHGAGGSINHWKPLFSRSEMEMSMIALDLPGHGLTDGIALNKISEVAEYIDQFLSKLELTQPITYVGHSLGGLIGLQFTLEFPKRMNRLILICTSARILLHPYFVEQALADRWDFEWLKGSFTPDVPEEKQMLVLNEFLHLRVNQENLDFFGVNQADLRSSVSQISIPTLVITSNDDVTISPRHSRFLAKELKDSVLVEIPKSGHYVHIEQPQIVAHEICKFCVE